MLSNMVASLFEYKRIRTTLAKAKEARRFADKMITFGKKGDVAARRQVYKFIPRREVVKILFHVIAPAFENRDGGYTRIVKLGRRKGDGAELAILELVGFEELQIEKEQQAKEKRAERKRRKGEEQQKREEEAATEAAAEAVAEAEAEKKEKD